MANKRPAYRVDDEWRQRVIRALDEKGWKRVDLARAAGCPPSTITELLNGQADQSPYLPAIHSALGWTPPQSPLPTAETEQLLQIWAKLDEIGQARLVERGLALIEASKKR